MPVFTIGLIQQDNSAEKELGKTDFLPGLLHLNYCVEQEQNIDLRDNEFLIIS